MCTLQSRRLDLPADAMKKTGVLMPSGVGETSVRQSVIAGHDNRPAVCVSILICGSAPPVLTLRSLTGG